MERKDGLQEKSWSGYFNDIDSIQGNWKRCMICNKIPCEIFYNSDMFFKIWHCKKCKQEEYKPNNVVEKLLMAIDAKFTK